jgi:hypothetical protein
MMAVNKLLSLQLTRRDATHLVTLHSRKAVPWQSSEIPSLSMNTVIFFKHDATVAFLKNSVL